MQTSENLTLRDVVSYGRACSHGLDNECKYVEKDEIKTESPCFEPQNLGAGCEVVHHSAQDHINVCIGPKRCKQYQNEPDRIIRFTCDVLDAEDAENVAGCLPQRSHCYDPAVAFAVDDGLDNMDHESEPEEDGEEVSGTRIWAKFWPLGIRICLSRAACHYERIWESLGSIALSKGRFGKQDSLKCLAIDLLLYEVKHETKPWCP